MEKKNRFVFRVALFFVLGGVVGVSSAGITSMMFVNRTGQNAYDLHVDTPSQTIDPARTRLYSSGGRNFTDVQVTTGANGSTVNLTCKSGESPVKPNGITTLRVRYKGGKRPKCTAAQWTDQNHNPIGNTSDSRKTIVRFRKELSKQVAVIDYSEITDSGYVYVEDVEAAMEESLQEFDDEIEQRQEEELDELLDTMFDEMEEYNKLVIDQIMEQIDKQIEIDLSNLFDDDDMAGFGLVFRCNVYWSPTTNRADADYVGQQLFVMDAAEVPEPASLVLLGLGLLMSVSCRKSRVG